MTRLVAHRSFTAEQLHWAVAGSATYHDVVRKLGLRAGGRTYRRLKALIAALGLDTSHFVGRKPVRWTDDSLRAAVAESRSYRQAIVRLGLVAAGGNYRHVLRRIRELELDTSHMTGQHWNRGMKYQCSPRTPLERVLVAGRLVGSHKLKKRLIRAGLKNAACELCGWAETSVDGRVPVELDHKNGDPSDNRIENLRILCPNCHSLQPTHRGLNQKCRRK